MKKKLWVLIGIFVGLNLTVLYLLNSITYSPTTKPAGAQETMITGGGEEAEGPAKIKREEAVKISLQQIASMIRYMFAAAAGFLAFIVKIMMDPLQKPKKERGSFMLADNALLLLLASALCLISSLLAGILAQGGFIWLATRSTFSFGGDFGLWILYQQTALIIGVAALVVAVAPSLITERR